MWNAYVRAGLIGAGLLLASCDDPARPDLRERLEISSDSAQLLIGDTIHLTAVVVNPAGGVLPSIAWTSLDSMVAAVSGDGRVVARQAGLARIIASANGISDTATIRVSRIGDCGDAGVVRSGAIATATTWTARESPHFVSDSIVVRAPLTIEAGAFICAGPRAHFIVQGGSITADGRSARRVQFVALDTVAGWQGISASASNSTPGGQIKLNHTDVLYGSVISVGFESTGEVNYGYLRRTAVGATANLNSFAIRNSVVEDANVAFSSGTFEETIVRRGNVTFFPAQPGSGHVTLNGGRIEDSPGVALTIGSTFSYRAPQVTVLKAPVIRDSRGGVATMPAPVFFDIWKDVDQRLALMNNVSRTIRLWGPQFGDLHLIGGMDWHLNSPISTAEAESLVIGAGATVNVDVFLTVRGGVVANGKPNLRITMRSSVGCLGSTTGCSLTLGNSASSTISYVTFEGVPLSVGEGHVVSMHDIKSNRAIFLRSPGSSILKADIYDVPAHPAGPQAGLAVSGDSVIMDRVIVRGGTSPSMAGIALSGNHIVLKVCDVTNNAGDGVRVTAGANITIQSCNIEANGGVGVNNQTANIVDARFNWWGDPAGPLGPNGDGFSGPVDFSSHLTTRRPPPLF